MNGRTLAGERLSTPQQHDPTARFVEPIATLSIDRVAAHAFLALYLLSAFEPFVILRRFPGSVSWALVPLLGVAVLVLTPPARLARTRLNLALLGVAAWTTMSLAWSTSFAMGWFTVRSGAPALILAMLVVGTMRPREVVNHLVVLMSAITWWSVIVSIAWIEARSSIIGTPPNIDEVQGWHGTFTHKNILGVFAVLGLVTTLAFVRRRKLRIALVVLYVVASFGTRSGTAGAGLLTAVALWSWLTWIGRIVHPGTRVIAKVGMAAVAAVSLATTFVTVPLFVHLYGKDLTLSGRTDIWSAAWRMIRTSPWVGHGVGSIWRDPSNPLTLGLRREIGFEAAHAHNGGLDVLLAVGAIGLAIFVIFLLGIVRIALRGLDSPTDEVYGRWALVCVAAIVVMSGSEPLFEGPTLGFLAIIWAVVAHVVAEAEARRVISTKSLALARSTVSAP